MSARRPPRRGADAPLDAIVVGGGAVGAACALALAGEGLAVALVDARRPPAWDAARPDLRVFAIAPDGARLFAELGAWDAIAAARAQPYRRMEVWDAAGGAPLAFDADRLGPAPLGHIIENALIVDRLWARLEAAGVRVLAGAGVHALLQGAEDATLELDDGQRLAARWVVAADGAGSRLRTLAGIGVAARDYGQSGLVAYVHTGQPHASTAWQRFLPGGPLAFLPCPDLEGEDAAPGTRCSIVWSLPTAEAARLRDVDAGVFARELTRAFDARLGEVVPASARVLFPLRRQLAHGYLRGRVLLLGDAAHAVHPLAGQGANLGLRDVAALRDAVRAAKAAGRDPLSVHRLERWARARRSEDAVGAYAFEGLNRLFSNDDPLLTLLRGPALGLVGRIRPLADAFVRHAAGG